MHPRCRFFFFVLPCPTKKNEKDENGRKWTKKTKKDKDEAKCGRGRCMDGGQNLPLSIRSIYVENTVWVFHTSISSAMYKSNELLSLGLSFKWNEHKIPASIFITFRQNWYLFRLNYFLLHHLSKYRCIRLCW